MNPRALPVLLLLTACSTQPLRDFIEPSVGAAALKAGIRQYDEGAYAEAARYLQGAIDLGLSDAQRERQCRDEFRKALAVDPALELDPAEAGHPVWGPVFRSIKAGR